MFGLLVSGRPIDHTPQSISPTQFAFRIPSNPAFSHIALFLLPGQSFPSADVGATVWIQLPSSNEFKLLGALAPNKQSAIFKISGVTRNGGGHPVQDIQGDVMVDESSAAAMGAQNPSGPEVVIGVSIESAPQIEAQLANLRVGKEQAQGSRTASQGSPVSTKVLAQRIIGNAFNFLASFGSDTVPLKAFQDWWTKFEKKVELDPGFLEREQG